MDPFHFACPHCSSRLRVREKLYVGRHVDCPECGDALLIVDEDKKIATVTSVVYADEKKLKPFPLQQGGK